MKKIPMKKIVGIQHSIASNKRAKDVKELVPEGSCSWCPKTAFPVSIHGFLWRH